jgi:hypothetical protein
MDKWIDPRAIDFDACIIDEQPDHLVFAIRVPRSVVRDNHAFLAAVLERADRPAAELQHKKWRRAMSWSAICLSTLLAAFQSTQRRQRGA